MAVSQLKFANFAELDPTAKYLSEDLLKYASRAESAFLRFASVWFAFNGWIECVSGEDVDSRMINAAASSDRLRDMFEESMANVAFRRKVNALAELWPVFNVRDIRRRLGRDALWKFDTETLRAECLAAGVRREPVNWVSGEQPMWDNALRAIYMVRCNLFHGAKSPASARDHALVEASGDVLLMFIDRSKCFEWH